jgi:hypothetical protein
VTAPRDNAGAAANFGIRGEIEMRKHFTKKRIVLLAVAALAIGIGTGAFAYFSSGGSGTGHATVGTSSTLALSSTLVNSGDLLLPGGPAVPMKLHIDNTSGAAQYVFTATGAVATSGQCLTEWFELGTLAGTTFTPGAVFNIGQTLSPDTAIDVDAAVRMLSPSGVNQDACKGVELTINWTSN